MSDPIRVLLVEDSDDDATLIIDLIQHGGFSPTSERVDNAKALANALSAGLWDVVIADHRMPVFDSTTALKMVKEFAPDLPFILVSGVIGEEAAVEAMRAGANDYVMKSNLSRLVPAIRRELREAANRRKQRAVEAELPRLYKEAQEGIKARDEFISVASHELKTPLTALQLQLHTAKRELGRLGLPEEGTKAVSSKLDLALVQTKRLGLLVENLLDVSRIATRGIELEKTEVDLAELIPELAGQFISAATQNSSHISVNQHRPIKGYWDRQKISQVLSNLLANAVKFGGGKPIDVSVDGDDHSVRITVTDRGIGLSQEDEARILESFSRAVSPWHFGGLGLGLYISHQIVLAHGGRLKVASQPGSGASFTVELPLR